MNIYYYIYILIIIIILITNGNYKLNSFPYLRDISFVRWIDTCRNLLTDLIANVTIARQGFPRMGYAACFGGPMFNTLLGLGLTYGVEAAKDPNCLTMMRLSDMAPGCLAFLVCSLLTSIIYMNITGSIARKSYGFLLYSIYFSFLIIQFLSELHIIHPLGIDHRPDIDPKGD